MVVRLDETQTKANLAVFTKSLDELYARQARLEAQKDGAESIHFPADLLAREANDPEVAHILDGERKLFAFRSEVRNGQKANLIEEELKGVVDLWQKQLVPFTCVTSLKRDAARLGGERGHLIASKAEAAGKIAEVELQIIQVDQDIRSKAAEELSDVRAKISEVSERKIAAEDQLKHIDIRAPQTGRVHELAVHTVGEVITPGETIMLIVPENDALSIQAKVSPDDIDELRAEQPALLRFSAFNLRTTLSSRARLAGSRRTKPRISEWASRVPVPGVVVPRSLGQLPDIFQKSRISNNESAAATVPIHVVAVNWGFIL